MKPVACDLTVFDAAERRRYDALRGAVASARTAIEELPDGYAFTYHGGAGLLATIEEWLALERRCCPFLAFELAREVPAGPICLRVVGDEDARRYLDAALGRTRG